MNGGATIFWGLLLLIVFIILLIQAGGALWTLLLGMIPLTLITAGLVLLAWGISEWRNQRAEAGEASQS